MENSNPASSSSNAPIFALALRHTEGLYVGKTLCRTPEDAFTAVMELPVTARYEATIDICNKLVGIHEGAELFMLGWASRIKDSGSLGLGLEESKAFMTEASDFGVRAKEVMASRSSKVQAYNALMKRLESIGTARATYFRELISQQYTDKGRNFYTEITQIIKKVGLHNTIRILNMTTLARNSVDGLQAYRMSPLHGIDVTESLTWATKQHDAKKAKNKTNPAAEIPELKASILKSLGFTFHECGLLLRGKFISGTVYPMFRDRGMEGQEDDEEEEVIISEENIFYNDTPSEVDNNAKEGTEYPAASNNIVLVTASSSATVLGTTSQEPEDVMGDVDFDQFLEPLPGSSYQVIEGTPTSVDHFASPNANAAIVAVAAAEVPIASVPAIPATQATLAAPLLAIPASKRKRKTKDDSTFSGSLTKKQRTTHVLRGTVLEITGCTCDKQVPAAWKALAALWQKNNFLEHIEVLAHFKQVAHYGFVNDGFFRMPCPRHIEYAASCLDMHYSLEHLQEMVQRFESVYDLVYNRKNFHLAWIHPSTRQFFKSTEEDIVEYRAKAITGDRFMSEKGEESLPLAPIIHSDYAFKWEPEQLFENCVVMQWMKNIASLHKQEVNMLKFHLRQGSIKLDGLLRNGYFTIAAQIAWGDPLIWKHLHENTKGRPVHFVAHPQPARCYLPGNLEHVFYEGDTRSLATTADVCMEALVRGETREVLYQAPIQPEKVEALVKAIFPERNYVNLSELPAMEIYSAYDLDNNLSLNTVPFSLQEGKLHMYRSGTIVNHSFVGPSKLTKSWYSLPLSYTAVRDGKTDSGVQLITLQNAHQNLTAPSIDRYGVICTDNSFLASQHVEGLGGIFDMITCQKPVTDPKVQRDIKRWSEYKSDKESNDMYLKWQKAAIAQARIAFDYLQDAEKSLFKGNKSYFRCIDEGLELPPAEAQDPEYIILSDTEEGDDASNKNRG